MGSAEPKRLEVAGAALAVGAAPSPGEDQAAKSFFEDLLRRGRLKVAKPGKPGAEIMRSSAASTHETHTHELRPVEAGESIYAPVPVSLSVALDPRGRIKSIDGDTPDPAAIADAARYIKTLRESRQLAAPGEQESTPGFTHRIERDEQGRQVLRRKRFSTGRA